MDNIKNTSELVKEVLKNSQKARNSDNHLYYLVCKIKLKGSGIDIDSISFRDGLILRSEFGLPNFETVRRTRQKIQHDFPELAGTADVEARRMIREEEFREYARSM